MLQLSQYKLERPLSDDASRQLLRKCADLDPAVELSAKIKPLEIDIIRACGSLPLALKIVGSLLRRESAVGDTLSMDDWLALWQVGWNSIKLVVPTRATADCSFPPLPSPHRVH